MIGSTLPSDSAQDGLKVVPMVATLPYLSTDTVYNSLEDYLAHLFRSRRLRLLNLSKAASDSDIIFASNAPEKSAAVILEALNKLEAYAYDIISNIKPSLRRCVVRHDDLNSTNILTNEHGKVTAVIDWELHSIQPAILAVEYPRLLWYEGLYDPSFAVPNRWWQVSREESAHLCDVFREVSWLPYKFLVSWD